MDLRLLTIALVFSFLPFNISFAQDKAQSFRRGDFVHAEETTKDGKSLIQFDLSQTGKEKVKELNKTEVNKKVALNINGKVYDFTLRQPIVGDKLQAGPFDDLDAKKIIREVNKN